MKMHSYITVNGQHQYASLRSAMVLDRLKKATWSVGGWEQAIADATPTKSDSDVSVERTASLSTPELTPLRTPDVSDDVTVTSVDMPTAIALRKRLAVITEQTNGNITTSFKNDNFSSSSGQNTPRAVESHPLVNHPDENISSLAKELSELQNDLTSPGPQYIRWPNNISLRDYALYLLVPTLVYEMEYPRTDRYVMRRSSVYYQEFNIRRIRPLYIFEKTVCTDFLLPLLFLCINPLGGNIWNVCPALHGYRKVHYSLYSHFRSAIPSLSDRSRSSIHDVLLVTLLHYFRYGDPPFGGHD